MRKSFIQIFRMLLFVSSLISVIFLITSLYQNRFASIWVERDSVEIRQKLNEFISSEVDHSWINNQLATATNTDPRDWDYIDFLIRTAQEERIVIDMSITTKIEESRQIDEQISNDSFACLECAYDSENCLNAELLVTCNLWVQLTPIGDIQTIVRNYEKSLRGESYDELETKLAILGLVATGAVTVSGGSSMVVKGVTSTLRVTMKAGILTDRFKSTLLNDFQKLFVLRWENLIPVITPGAGKAKQIVEPEALKRLYDTASNLNRMYVTTGNSLTEMFALLRYVDNAKEAKLLANISESVGTRARTALAVAGKSRVLRVALRWSDEFFQFIVLLIATIVQLAGLALSFSLNKFLRGIETKKLKLS